MGEMSERDSDVQVIVDKAMIEISKTEEGLNIFNLPRFRPLTNNLDFVISILSSLWFSSFQYIAKKLY